MKVEISGSVLYLLWSQSFIYFSCFLCLVTDGAKVQTLHCFFSRLFFGDCLLHLASHIYSPLEKNEGFAPRSIRCGLIFFFSNIIS